MLPPAAPYTRDRRTLAAFALLVTLGGLQVTLGTVLPYLRAELDLSYAAASLHLSAFAVAGVPTSLLAARLQRHAGRIGVVATGAVGMVGGIVVLVLAGTQAVTLAGAALLGGGATLAFIGLWSALSDQHGERRAVVLSEGEAAVSVGTLSLPLAVGASEAAGAGWRAGLLVGAGLALATLAVLRLAGGVHEAPPAASAVPLPWRRLAPLLGALTCFVAVEWTLTTWMAIHLDENAGLGREAAVALSSVFFAAMLAGRLAGSRLARRVGARTLLVAALAVLVAALPVLALATGPGVALAGLLLCGATAGALFPLGSALVFAAAGAASTRASGAIMRLSAVAVILAPVTVGALAEAAGLRIGLAAAAVLPLAGLFLLARPRWQRHDHGSWATSTSGPSSPATRSRTSSAGVAWGSSTAPASCAPTARSR